MTTHLVGEMNPYGADPEFALYPLPEHASGGRLAKILGMSRGQYLRAFERHNLCVGKWSMPAAREAANKLVAAAAATDRFVLLGRKVSDAFGVPFVPFAIYGLHPEDLTPPNGLVLPHPSGRNPVWGTPGFAETARIKVAKFLQPTEVPDAVQH